MFSLSSFLIRPFQLPRYSHGHVPAQVIRFVFCGGAWVSRTPYPAVGPVNIQSFAMCPGVFAGAFCARFFSTVWRVFFRRRVLPGLRVRVVLRCVVYVGVLCTCVCFRCALLGRFWDSSGKVSGRSGQQQRQQQQLQQQQQHSQPAAIITIGAMGAFRGVVVALAPGIFRCSNVCLRSIFGVVDFRGDQFWVDRESYPRCFCGITGVEYKRAVTNNTKQAITTTSVSIVTVSDKYVCQWSFMPVLHLHLLVLVCFALFHWIVWCVGICLSPFRWCGVSSVLI